MMRRLASFFAVAVLLLASCSKPDGSEQFILASDAPRGEYSFTLDFSEPGASYDLSFFTAVDARLFTRPVWAPFRVDVRMVAPSGAEFEETVYYQSGEKSVPYRTGVVPREWGEWKLLATVSGAPEGLRGLGLMCKTVKDGSR